jgi:RHS repeat-associated protein
VTQPDAKVTRTAYTLRGEIFRVWGGATYPLERTYDAYGQPQFLKTYRAGTAWAGNTWPATPGTADATEWKYFDATGQLYQKLDAAGKAITYSYSADGKMQTRQRARGLVTTYTWNGLGLLAATSHNDGTPAVTTQYDRASRPKTLVDAAGTHSFDYSVPLKTTENIVGGILGGTSRSITRDTYERPSAISVTSSGETQTTAYQYPANASRLESVTNATESASYAYLPNSDAIQTLTFRSGSTTRLTTTRSFDASDRLEGLTNSYATSQTQTYGVAEFDAMNRRKKITREDATRWNYGYNDKGEVTSGIREKTAIPNTAVPGWSHGYSFDEIGNRLSTTTNGRASTYTPNSLNQLTSRSVPRAFDVIGKATATAAVTVNALPTVRLDEYFYKELPAVAGATHVPYSIAATDASGTTSRSGGKFLPASPEFSTYDLDGNLTSDGRFSYVWDAENRLIAMETLATVPVIAQRKLTFAYDAMGRRIRKTTWVGAAAGTWQLQLEIRFLHQLGGWNTLAEITADNKFLRSYTWGNDLSGNLSGAGGVGGLLFTKIHPDNSIHANGMDLNGNVSLLVSTTTGQATATYDYGPFGEPLRESGEYAKLNPYRFSTKYTDDESGLLDYGLRYYIPSTGRWLNRDPIEEKGGANLYGFVSNKTIGKIDFLGYVEINTWTEAVNYYKSVYRSNSQDEADAGSDLMEQIKNSKGFKASKKTTLNSIIDQLKKEPDLCNKCSGSIKRTGKQIGFDAGNWVVGNITVNVKDYEINWYRDGGTWYGAANFIFTGARELDFKDKYEFNGTWDRPKSFFTDTLPWLYAGNGTPYFIKGEWTDKLKGSFSKFCSWF